MRAKAVHEMNKLIAGLANQLDAFLRLCGFWPSCAVILFIMAAPSVRVFAGGFGSAPLASFGIEANGGRGWVELDRVQQSGAQWTRLAGLWWPSVEPEEGKYDWTAMQWLESLFIQSRDRGLTPILVVRGTPDWAQQSAGVACGTIRSDKLMAFADFMAAVVEHYGNEKYNVKYWELGNEPDIDPKLVDANSLTGCWGDDTDAYYGGGAYAEMLKVTYPRIKQADPSATVLVGGLVLDCDPRPDGGCPNDARSKPPRFFEGILRAGGGDYFDGVSYHSYDYYDRKPGEYGNSNWRSDSATTGPVSVAKAAYIRELLAKYGAGNKRLYNTEDALLCNACMNDAGYEWTKAFYAASLNLTALSTHLSASIWFRLSDWPGTALVDADMTPTRAYEALRASATRLTGATVERELTGDELGAPGLRGVLLTRGTEQYWLVWAVDGAEHSLKLTETPHRIDDVLGQRVETTSTTIKFSAPDHLLYYLTW